MTTAVPHRAPRPVRAARPRVPAPRRGARRVRTLGSYSDGEGRRREVVARAGSSGTLLVIDRDEASGREERLVAHLGADEPAGNAALVCRGYLRGGLGPAGPCRPLTPQDASTVPFPDEAAGPRAESAVGEVVAIDGLGAAYMLAPCSSRMSIPELRWCRAQGAPRPVSLREAIGALEDYEPLCAVTREAVRRHRDDQSLSTTVLQAELERVARSPIVLNRRLREAVLAVVERGELSMSEIAIRCGRVKRDRKGNRSGETSWLARRLGLLAEGGSARPTPWVHSDVLGLIAREGLGLAPREVEL